MRETVAYPGVRFWLYKLEGKLICTHHMPDQPPRQFTVSKDDYEQVEEMEEGDHPQEIVDLGGKRRVFSASFGEEVSIVLMNLRGTLDMEYYYDSRDFQKVIFKGFGPWPPANAITQPVIQDTQHTNTSVGDNGAALNSDSQGPAPPKVPKEAQKTRKTRKTQKTLPEARGASSKTQVAPPDEQQDLLDTEESPTDTPVTPPDIIESVSDSQKPLLDIDAFDESWIYYLKKNFS
ncbi:uncharacterized protein J4E78_007682 [Alternaria triticimaculans]|uniref:uncharacterized protein n=1 Tax=Alternaria triticimaculans TaxID=297637 RepID=UPI0020C4E175|nr:uncharacterized protein J4E78_007682 [Alternaria triticimaculans]KAI4652855.1 hypothetical protein J4E78_007682 [Alternaria triticimaculans]